MLYILGSELYSCGKAGEGTGLPFFTADLISRRVCLIIFLAYPTTNTRPVIEGSGFWDLLAGWLYSIDAADNLFPSIHCLVSWFCFLGIKDQKKNSGMV